MSAVTVSVDMSSLFRSIVAVLSKVIDKQSLSTDSWVLVACDPYQPLWDCAAGVYCNSLLGKPFLKNSLSLTVPVMVVLP